MVFAGKVGSLQRALSCRFATPINQRESNMRQIHLVAFLQAQNCTTIPAAWRHPDARIDTYSPQYYRHIARVLEDGKFDVGFFDDRLAMPDMYSGDHAHTVENGIRCVKLDATTCLMTMAAATRHLGLGATYSTTYYEPFHVARVFQTIDLMTEGRAAWNVVTSVNDNEARNMGRGESVIEHDTRYDRADEFMEIVLGHWDSWTTTPSLRTRPTISTPKPTRSGASTTRAVSCRRAGRSPCRAHHKDIRSSCRPA